MNTLSKRIKFARKEAGITQAELARRSGLKQGTIAGLESGKSGRTTSAAELSSALGISMEWLATGNGGMKENATNWTDNVIPTEPPRMRVPLISWVRAGAFSDIDADCQNDDYDEWVDVQYSKPSSQSFALTVQGDSMTWGGKPNFPEGTKIIVDPNRSPQVGDYVIAKDVDTQRATFKKLTTDDVNFYLKPLNSSYPTVPVDDPNMRCIGVVIEYHTSGKL